MWWIASAAFASQVFDEVVPLSEILPGADAVVVVAVDGPPVDAEVANPGGGPKCAAVPAPVQPVVVRRVLAQDELGPLLQPGDRLDVRGGSLETTLHVAWAWCRTETSVSPIVLRVEGERPEPGRELVALLRWDPPLGWVELADGAWAAADRADELAQAWSSGSHRAAPEPAGFEVAACRLDAECVAAVPACGDAPKWQVAHRQAVASLDRACGDARAEPPRGRAPVARCLESRCVAR